MRALLFCVTLLGVGWAQPSPQNVPPPPRPSGDDLLADQPGIDVLTDGALLSFTTGFAALSQLIISTGEIRPQQPVDADSLLAIDRRYAENDNDRFGPGLVSDGGLFLVLIYAGTGSVLTARKYGARSGWVDLVLYAESAAFNLAIANLSKIAVRRPRPRAYLDLQEQGEDAGTDSALSFYSSHTAMTAGLVTTATYLAFVRHPDSSLGWWVMGIGSGLVGAVGWGRVQAREHFPTDVIAGVMAGAGIGILVPHLHMPHKQRHYWVGPTTEGAGLVLGGAF